MRIPINFKQTYIRRGNPWRLPAARGDCAGRLPAINSQLGRGQSPGIALTGLLLLLVMTLLVACGGSTAPQSKAPTPTPTIGPGQLLLNTVAQKLNTAQTLHGIFDIQITGQAFNGMVNTEVWNASPGKYRTVVLQSSIAQFSTGSIDVSNAKTIWQYDPQKKVVYTGPIASSTSGGTPTATNGGGNGTGSETQLIFGLVQSIFS